jgi:hypothetical protein
VSPGAASTLLRTLLSRSTCTRLAGSGPQYASDCTRFNVATEPLFIWGNSVSTSNTSYRLLCLPAVVQITGLSRSMVYLLVFVDEKF